jgi:apolipoprotein N-acyltransferase
LLDRLGLLALDGRFAEARGRRQAWSVAVLLVAVGAACGYGIARRVDGRFEAGPRVALIQGNFTSSLKHDPGAWEEMFQTHTALTGLAVREQPDVIVWPETMFTWPLMTRDPELSDDRLTALSPYIPVDSWKSNEVPATLAGFAEQCRASMILGLETFEATEAELRRYNSAVLVDPGAGISGRYDKLHRVPFGEFIPFSKQLPLLQRVFAFSGPVGISAGDEIHFFNVDGTRFAPLICFEDTVPHLVREIVAAGESQGEDVDCLVNLTNDGWFHGSSELEQHLITASFRCIETRTPMIRAVNTGISAIIDGDGLVREPSKFIDYDAMRTGEPLRDSMRDPATGEFHKQLNAALIGYVPLDARTSLYTHYGDWFAMLCAAICCVAALSSRWLPVPEPKTTP